MPLEDLDVLELDIQGRQHDKLGKYNSYYLFYFGRSISKLWLSNFEIDVWTVLFAFQYNGDVFILDFPPSIPCVFTSGSDVSDQFFQFLGHILDFLFLIEILSIELIAFPITNILLICDNSLILVVLIQGGGQGGY